MQAIVRYSLSPKRERARSEAGKFSDIGKRGGKEPIFHWKKFVIKGRGGKNGAIFLGAVGGKKNRKGGETGGLTSISTRWEGKGERRPLPFRLSNYYILRRGKEREGKKRLSPCRVRTRQKGKKRPGKSTAIFFQRGKKKRGGRTPPFYFFSCFRRRPTTAERRDAPLPVYRGERRGKRRREKLRSTQLASKRTSKNDKTPQN